MRSKLLIGVLALATASFTFAAKKPKTATPAGTEQGTTQTEDHAHKVKGKKHKKEQQPPQKPATN